MGYLELDLRRIVYLCFVAYNFDNLPQFVEKIQEQYKFYKNKSYKRSLFRYFLFPELGFKILDLSNTYMKDKVFDSNNETVAKWGFVVRQTPHTLCKVRFLNKNFNFATLS